MMYMPMPRKYFVKVNSSSINEEAHAFSRRIIKPLKVEICIEQICIDLRSYTNIILGYDASTMPFTIESF